MSKQKDKISQQATKFERKVTLPPFDSVKKYCRILAAPSQIILLSKKIGSDDCGGVLKLRRPNYSLDSLLRFELHFCASGNGIFFIG